YWHFNNPAEQHITNLYASLPKALMFASCQNLESCKSLFDEPSQKTAK
ncbi:alpha/beta hydrolase, partial [Acinetobacter baumannii]|nr:alpha/beta hydrolase [Acinetobacter baumannii]